MAETPFPFSSLESIFLNAGAGIIWTIVFLATAFFLFSFFIVRYHLSHYSVSTKEALFAELTYIIISVVMAFTMIISLIFIL